MFLTRNELVKVLEEFFEDKNPSNYFYRHELYDGVRIQLDGTYNLEELADKLREAFRECS